MIFRLTIGLGIVGVLVGGLTSGCAVDALDQYDPDSDFVEQQEQNINEATAPVVRFVSRQSNKCLDVDGAGTANGTNIQLWRCNDTNAQAFRVEALGDGRVRYKNVGSNKCIDVSAAATYNGANIQLWECNNTAAQSFYKTDRGDGYYSITNSNSRKSLDVAEWGTADGSNIQQWDFSWGHNQMWRPEELQSTDPTSSDPIFTDRVCTDRLVRGASGQHTWGSSYTNWSSKGGNYFEQKIRIDTPAPSTFHTQYFNLTNAKSGYFGLQTGSIKDGKVSTQVRFSLWNALDGKPGATESGCQTFGHEGSGWSCHIPNFGIEFGVFYTLKIKRLGDSSDGKVWWEATVTNDRTQKETVVGRIQTLHTSQPHQLKLQQNFSEYWGPRAIDCNHVPQSIVDWQKPSLTNDGADVAVTFKGFTKAGDPARCSDEGTFAKGEELFEDGKTLYRMTNGSIPMCE